jgi:peroxiredoxin
VSSIDDLYAEAEVEWLDKWTTGPTQSLGSLVAPGTAAPDMVLPDHTGQPVTLSDLWAETPALLMFWRHFGCTCGLERAERLSAELDAYASEGLRPIIVSQGEPERAAAYRSERRIDVPVLCDPDQSAYGAYGVGQWSVEQVLFDAPAAYWSHPRQLGAEFQAGRREQGRPPVDDPWLAAAEFVVGPDGIIRLSYAYQYCEDYPDPRVLTTAARLSRSDAWLEDHR